MTFVGTVRRAFVDRHTKQRYAVGSTYETDSEQRVEEIRAAGESRGFVYVDFEDAVPADDGMDLAKMTVAQLREFAESVGVELTATKKADIVAELEARFAETGE